MIECILPMHLYLTTKCYTERSQGHRTRPCSPNMEEQELSTFYTIPVLTYDQAAPPLQVSVSVGPGQDGVSVEELLKKVCQSLGIMEDNISCFVLVEGRSCPRRRYRSDDVLPTPVPELCLKKWTFTAESERPLVDDPAALHLLHLEAESDINSGRIKPTKQQLERLEEYIDPSFCLQNQYVLLCQNVDLYWSVSFNNVNVCKCSSDQNHNSFISTHATIDLYITPSGIEIHQGGNRGWVPWVRIQSWTVQQTSSTIEFNIMCMNAAIWCLKLETNQLQYLLAAMSEILKSQQTEDSYFYTSMISRDKEEDKTTFENALFSPTPQGDDPGQGQPHQGQSNDKVPKDCIDLTALEVTVM